MTIALDLATEQEAKLRAQAQAQAEGLTPPDYLKKLAGLDESEDTQSLPPGSIPSRLVQGSPEWRAVLRSTFHSARPLTDEETRRENIYGDDLR